MSEPMGEFQNLTGEERDQIVHGFQAFAVQWLRLGCRVTVEVDVGITQQSGPDGVVLHAMANGSATLTIRVNGGAHDVKLRSDRNVAIQSAERPDP